MRITTFYKLLVFHVFLGVAVFVFRPMALLFFLIISGFFTYKILFGKASLTSYYVLTACAYMVGAEVFLRMNGGTVFYEAIKYLVIFYTGLGMLRRGFTYKSLIYIVYILLLIPGIFVAVQEMGFETNIRKAIAFNLSGPVCLGITALFCYKRNVSFSQMNTILTALLLPLVSMTAYLFLYTPDVQAVVRGTGSNFATSGGFGPNQVATVLGLGIFVAAIRFFRSKELVQHKVIDLFILGLLGFRALVTFSRGGVLVALIMIISFLSLYYLKVNLQTKFKIKFSLSVFVGVLFLVWLVSSIQTHGFIENRYANEDALGREKEDVTTGRVDLLAFEFNEYMKHPFVGLGVGKVKEVRQEETGVAAASHNEMSRIVAEHGLLGIIAFLILLLTPLVHRIYNRSNIYFYAFYAFWILTINHSAMRIAAPAFIYGLCLLNITYEKTPVHRKQIK